MLARYIDTRALVRRYVPAEVGSAWVTDTLAPMNDAFVYISAITRIEFVAAIKRKVRMRQVDPTGAGAAIDQFARDCRDEYRIIEVRSPVIHRAITLLDRYPLRAYDALQLATALLARDLHNDVGEQTIFIASDETLNQAAVGEGLVVENPATHA